MLITQCLDGIFMIEWFKFFLYYYYVIQNQEYDIISLSADHSSYSQSLEFDFRGGSIGNFVFTGARLFFNSLEAAIFWFSNLSAIPEQSRVIPVLNVNTR